MKVYITGIGGLVGSAVAREGLRRGHEVWGTEADYRGAWFGPEGSTKHHVKKLRKKGARVVEKDFRACPLPDGVNLIVHCASQPSHDYSRSNVLLDSSVNYSGTVYLLEQMRHHAPEAIFVFMSTNKVYGDRVNMLGFHIEGKRFVPNEQRYAFGINEGFPIDGSLHTPFGVSKAAADLMVQEYSRCFGLHTMCLRGGCLTGVGGAPVAMQGFLGYLVKCAVEGKSYTIYGHNGYQVRDNIDSTDVARAIYAIPERLPQQRVYNIGGGPRNSISVLEAIDYLKTKHGCNFEVSFAAPRIGDHQWWISDLRQFQHDYFFKIEKSVEEILDEMVLFERSR